MNAPTDISANTTFPCRSMYVIATAVIALFVIAFAWLAGALVVEKVAAASLAVVDNYTSSPAYNVITYARQFLEMLWKSLPAVALIGVLLWAVIYSQRKGEVI